jgi:hypothetical protein
LHAVSNVALDRSSAGIPTPASQAAWARRWLVLPPLVLAAVVYYPVTGAYFFADDFLNLYHIANRPLVEYLVTPNGGHILVTRNAIFFLTAKLFGAQPAPYYWSALLTHLLNVWLLYRLVRLLTGRPALASFGACLWGISPSVEGTIGWYSVYGHALVAVALLIILHQAVERAAQGTPPSLGTRVVWYGLALGAATSFGTGTGIALVLPAALWLLGFPSTRRRRAVPLLTLVVTVPVLYALLMWAYETLAQTQVFGLRHTQLLLAHWETIPRYLGHFIALGFTRLVLGFAFRPSLPMSVWYGLSAGLLVVVLLALRTAPRRMSRPLLACVVLLLGCYGTVAAGRSYYLSTLSPEFLVLLSRYHYVGELLLCLILCLALHSLLPSPPRWAGRALLAAWYGLAFGAWLRWAPAIDQHEQARNDTREALTAIRAAIEARAPGETVYIDNRRFESLPLPALWFPGWAAVFTIFHPDNSVEGRRVYFVERRPAVRARMADGRRTAALVVAPAEAGKRDK